MAELVFMRDHEVLMRAPLRAPALRLGRSPDADLVVPDKAVSRLQCRLVAKGHGWLLEDLSGRGTPVSNRIASESGTALRDGDTIRLGELVATYSTAEADPTDGLSLTGPKAPRGRTHKLAATTQLTRAELRVLRPEGESVIPLRPDEGYKVSVGSDPTGHVQVVLEDPLVSADHFRISVRKGRWMLTDLDSANGTWVDGVRVVECMLGTRSLIRAGESQLWFERATAHAAPGDEPIPGLITRDPAMSLVVDAIRRYAPVRVPVAIRGETGAGKEVVAQALHRLGDRREQPFIALNCGALPKETLESELFGHEKGAFTGAEKSKPGAFEEADGGTLFLDEIGDLPLLAQVKLLRVLELGEVRRLGASGSRQVDVRVVCATHRDLAAMVEDGQFREDLYYRLCVASIELPPLRHRISDVVPLALHFATRLAPGVSITFTAGARARLESHPWHGNARELRNVVQTALLHRRGTVITEDDLLFRPAPRRQKVPSSIRVAGLTMEQVERETYRLALDRHDGDRKKAQDELGVARATFFRRLGEFGLE